MNLTEIKTDLKQEFIKQAHRADTALTDESEYYEVTVIHGDGDSVTLKREEDGLEWEIEVNLDTVSRAKAYGQWELKDENGDSFVIQFMGLEPLQAHKEEQNDDTQKQDELADHLLKLYKEGGMSPVKQFLRTALGYFSIEYKGEENCPTEEEKEEVLAELAEAIQTPCFLQ